jgi:TRAP-type mannitol/chloroaromatic compound transport system permease small subunit
MKKIINFLDTITHITGTSVAWLTLAMIIAVCIVVFTRFFGVELIKLNESVTYMHAAVFMLAIGWTLQRDGHVRVDIFYRQYSETTRAWIDILGTLLFTLPFMLFIGIGSWDFVLESWRINEGSNDFGGLALVFLLKSLIPLMALSVVLQSLSIIARKLIFLMTADHNLLQKPEQESQHVN